MREKKKRILMSHPGHHASYFLLLSTLFLLARRASSGECRCSQTSEAKVLCQGLTSIRDICGAEAAIELTLTDVNASSLYLDGQRLPPSLEVLRLVDSPRLRTLEVCDEAVAAGCRGLPSLRELDLRRNALEEIVGRQDWGAVFPKLENIWLSGKR